ncbi:energy-coupling factor ABC transporter ATP-binding protein [Cohnella nanjingensis]|nr:ABC transporter ATP-binding protein [Cohnella nanjingensis]
MSENRESLRFTNLSVYAQAPENQAVPRLAEVTIALAPGEWLNVVGTNGSGKSTLAQLLAGLVQEGAAGGYERGFAGDRPAPYVMQQPDAQLFGGTPREELVFALEWRAMPSARIMPAAEEMLRAVGLFAVADEPWERLSGGQRQLAAVAAATAGEAPLLVLDEATSMLDEAARGRVREAAERLHAAGTAIVWVTQRLDELAPQARVIAMQEGRIAFDGTGRQFLYGTDEARPSRADSACERVGLRLPYLAALAFELHRLGRIQSPLPMTPDEWQRIEWLGQDMKASERRSYSRG